MKPQRPTLKPIKQATRIGTDVVLHFKDDKEKPMICRSIRGGLTFPVEDQTGYLLVAGQLPQMNKHRKYPIVVFREAQAALPETLFNHLIDAARGLLCWDFFTDLTMDTSELYDMLEDFLMLRDMTRISLEPPPVTDWNVAVLMLQQWINEGSLFIPDGMYLHNELRGMTVEDRLNAAKVKLPGANALRCVVSSFLQPQTMAMAGTVQPGAYKYD